MAKTTKNYRLNILEQGDVWFPNLDQSNMQVIENLLKVAEYFIGSGIIQITECSVLSSASESYKQAYFNAAFDYYHELFFNVANNETQFVSNEDTLVDLVADQNVVVASMLSTLIDGQAVKPGYAVFLTNQSSASENGVYDVSLSGATRRAEQPKKVFVKSGGTTYGYSIWNFNDAHSSKISLNTFDCMIVVDGLISLDRSKALTPSTTCYIRPTSAGDKYLIPIAPQRFYGTGTPILFSSATNLVDDATLATYTATATSWSNFYSVSALTSVNSTNLLVDFSNQTYEARESLKSLHVHSNSSAKLGLSSLEKVVLVPISSSSPACQPFDVDGNIFQYDSLTQSIHSLYINGISTNINNITYNSSTGYFDLIAPAGSLDEIIMLIYKVSVVKLEPLPSTSNTESYFIVQGSNAVDPYTWSEADYSNYQLYLNGNSISQQSYTVDSSTGLITLVDPNYSNLPINSAVLQAATVEISSSTADRSSFFGSTNKIAQVVPDKAFYNQTTFNPLHNQFSLQKATTGKNFLPLIPQSTTEYLVPYITNNEAQSYELVADVDYAIYSENNCVLGVNNKIFTILNNQIDAIFEAFDDSYPTLMNMRRINNSSNAFILLKNNGSTGYLIGVANFDTSEFLHYEFQYTDTINDLAAVVINSELLIFLATNKGVVKADFSKLNPKFTKLFYNITTINYDLLSYTDHNVVQLAISSINDDTGEDYEIYAVIKDFPVGGDYVLAALRNQVEVLYNDNTIILHEIGGTNGVSNNGIIYSAATINETHISVSPFRAPDGTVYFPFTYGELLTFPAAIVCSTATIAYIEDFTSVPKSALDFTTINVNDYILVRNQVDPAENGIYQITAISGDYFSATKQTITNLAVGNYAFITNGEHYEGSNWQIDFSSPLGASDEIYFSLSSTTIFSGDYTTYTKFFSDLNNTFGISENGNALLIYDSSYVGSDIYHHNADVVSTTNQVLAISPIDNTVITNKSILSDDKTTVAQTGNTFIDYVYPLGVGEKIHIYNSLGKSWKINQLLSLENNEANINAVVTNSFSGSYDLEVATSNVLSAGEVSVKSANYVFENFVDNPTFTTEWWNTIYANSSGSFLTPLVENYHFNFDVENRKITLLTSGSSFSGSILFGEQASKRNLKIDSKYNFNPVDHTEITDYNDKTVGEFNYTTSGHYTLEHSGQAPSETGNTVFFTEPTSNETAINVDDFTGTISAQSGKIYNSINRGVISDTAEISSNSTYYTNDLTHTQNIERGLMGQNVVSSLTTSNLILLDQALKNAVSGYSGSISTNNISDFYIDSTNTGTYQNDLSDFEAGGANYNVGSNFGISKEIVSAIFEFNDDVYAVIPGKICSFSYTSTDLMMVMTELDFGFCHEAVVYGDYVYLGTDNGLFIVDADFQPIHHSCQGQNVSKIFYDSNNGFLVYAVENTLSVVSVADGTTDEIVIDCERITSIEQIYISNLSSYYLLIGTTDGLFGFTLNLATSLQPLTYKGRKYLGGKKLILDPENIRAKIGLTKNSIAGMYQGLQGFCDNDETIDTKGQPYITDIRVIGADVILMTDSGIIKYNSIYNLDLESTSKFNQSFNKTETVLAGISVYKSALITDTTKALTDLYLVFTTNGLYYTFDNFNSFIKSSVPELAICGAIDSTTGYWCIGTVNQLYYTANGGETFTSINLPRGIKLTGSKPLFATIEVNHDFSLERVSIPAYIEANAFDTFVLTIYKAYHETGVSSGAALSTQSLLIPSDHKGLYLLKFNITPSLALRKGCNYVFKLTTTTTGRADIGLQHFESDLFTINRQYQGVITDINVKQAIKLCNSSAAGNLTIRQPLDFSGDQWLSNLVSGPGYTPYTTGEVNFILDNSKSFLSYSGGTGSILDFGNTIANVINNRFDVCFTNYIFTDKSLTGFNALAESGPKTLSMPSVVDNPTQSRITDAINSSFVRINSGRFSGSTFASSGSSGPYYQYLNSNPSGADLIFKNILESAPTIGKLKIDYNFNSLANSGSWYYNLSQSGFTPTIGVTDETYVFMDTVYMAPGSYTIVSGSQVLFNTVVSGSLLSQVNLYVIPDGPTVSSTSTLKNQSYFTDYWRNWLASTQSKVIVVLSDYIDNYSFSDLIDFISLTTEANKHYLIILCGGPIINSGINTLKNAHVINIPRTDGETWANYITRVSTFASNLVHPAFCGNLDFVIDKQVESINVSFNNLTVFAEIKDLYTQEIIAYTSVANGVDVPTNQTPEQKIITLSMSGDGNITSVILNYSIENTQLFTMPYTSRMAYSGSDYILSLTNGLSNSKINATTISGPTKITSLSPGWSLSPNITPSWKPLGAKNINGSFTFSGSMRETSSDVVGYNKFITVEKTGQRFPINSSFYFYNPYDEWSVGGDYEAQKNLDPNCATLHDVANTLGTLINSLDLNSGPAYITSNSWWSWLHNQKSQRVFNLKSQADFYTDPSTAWYLEYPNNVSGSKVKITAPSIAIFGDDYAQFRTSQIDIVKPNVRTSALSRGLELEFDSSRVLKLVESVENQQSYTHDTAVNLYSFGKSVSGPRIISGSIINLNRPSVFQVLKPSTPSANSTALNVAKYRSGSGSYNIVGFYESFDDSGRKIRYTSQSSWTLSGSAFTGSCNVFNKQINTIQNLSIFTANTVGESGSRSMGAFSTILDDNYSPKIISVSVIKSNTATTSAGLNDKLSVSVLIDRNDGLDNAEYIYKFNTGDTINLNVSWYGCTSAGDGPVLISSSYNLTITDSIYSAYSGGFIFAKIKTQRGLTTGEIMASSPIFVI